jgi:large subunit ribosomal protein L35
MGLNSGGTLKQKKIKCWAVKFKGEVMPKMKTHRGAAKRFKLKKNGTIKRGSAYRSHILTKMSQKRKRDLRSPQVIAKSDEAQVKSMLAV